ncbi:MAG: hypothetical protein M1526_03020 [Candidatus Thermoplasmatota archaeon]|nr:hypothetical protein [Candidatus Thermoplasmatota archaeon]
MAQTIEIEVKRFFPRFGYYWYLAKFPDDDIVNFRISKNVLEEPKPETKNVILEWG